MLYLNPSNVRSDNKLLGVNITFIAVTFRVMSSNVSNSVAKLVTWPHCCGINKVLVGKYYINCTCVTC